MLFASLALAARICLGLRVGAVMVSKTRFVGHTCSVMLISSTHRWEQQLLIALVPTALPAQMANSLNQHVLSTRMSSVQAGPLAIVTVSLCLNPQHRRLTQYVTPALFAQRARSPLVAAMVSTTLCVQHVHHHAAMVSIYMEVVHMRDRRRVVHVGARVRLALVCCDDFCSFSSLVVGPSDVDCLTCGLGLIPYAQDNVRVLVSLVVN